MRIVSTLRLFIAIHCIATSILSLPPVNLGRSSFLDGGPLRPRPGFYFQQYLVGYHSNKIIDAYGNALGNSDSPHSSLIGSTTQFICQFQPHFFSHAQTGMDISLPAALYAHIDKNKFGIQTTNHGLGNIFIGMFMQFNPIFIHHNRPLFVHRIEFVAAFPTGQSNSSPLIITPGTDFMYLDPYWAFTLYFSRTWAMSCRIHYLWCAESHSTQVQQGSTIHANFSLEHAILPRFWIGINGYFLQQLRNDKRKGVSIPETKECVLALGIGGVYATNERIDFVMFLNFYAECLARNRPQGISLVFHILKYF